MIPMQKAAQRIIHHSQSGTFDSVLDGELGRLDNIAEAENSRVGKRGGVGQFVLDRGGSDPEGPAWFDTEQPPTRVGWSGPTQE
jgi:hypothetical protein